MAARGRPPKSIYAQEANRTVHRSNDEKEARKAAEDAVKVPIDGLPSPPKWLTAEEKARFSWYAEKLHETNPQLCTDLDVTILANLVNAESAIEEYAKLERAERRKKPGERDDRAMATYAKLKNAANKEARDSASLIGVGWRSRQGIELPDKEDKPDNPFAQFDAGGR